MRFAGKTVVITGAASGIGRATVLKFVAEGATVFAADINEARGQALVAESNGDLRFKHCDVAIPADIKNLMDFAAEATGGIDVLFNNAGVTGSRARIDEIEADDWDRTMNILLRSVAMGIRYAVPHMKGRKGASIINTGSISTVQAGFGATCYSVAKSGVVHLTKIAAAELAQHGIRVNGILPGMINTDIYAGALGVSADKFEEIKPKLAELSAHAQPVARPGVPDDIAAMVLFLASEDASFITGSNMLVDGGMTVGTRASWDPDVPNQLAPLLK